MNRKEDEIVLTREERNGYSYGVIRFDDLVMAMIKNRNSEFYLHEYIEPFRPLRLFLDIDRKGGDYNTHLAEMNDIVAKVCTALLPLQATYVIFEAVDPSGYKASWHILFDVWCENVNALVGFLSTVSIDIDMTVYSTMSGKTLRLPYCCKRHDNPGEYPRRMLPMGIKEPTFFVPVKFCSGLIAINKNDSIKFKHLLPEIPKEFHLKDTGDAVIPRKRVRTLGGENEEEQHTRKVLDRFEKWLKMRNNMYVFRYQEVVGSRASLHVSPAPFCEIKGGRHGDNNCSFNLQCIGLHTVVVTIYCYHPDCRMTFPYADDISKICCYDFYNSFSF